MDYVILDGQPKQLLMVQLNDIGRGPAVNRVPFLITVCKPEDWGRKGVPTRQLNRKLALLVYGLRSRDGLGNVWVGQAYTNQDLGDHKGPVHVEFDYDTVRRTGCLTITDGPEPLQHC